MYRLHHRVETARAALEAALARRHEAVLALAAADGSPVTRELPGAVAAAREAGQTERELWESALSRALRSSLESPGAVRCARRLRPWLPEVEAAARGVHLARTFYNDAVSDTRRARRSRLVRTFRLTGTAVPPVYFEIDDRPPRTPSPAAEPDVP